MNGRGHGENSEHKALGEGIYDVLENILGSDLGH